MQIRAGFEISIRCEYDTPLVALLSVHPSRAADLRSPADITTDHALPRWTFTDPFGNTCLRTTAPEGLLSLETSFLIEDSGLPDSVAEGAGEVPVGALPDAVMPYLLGSRYCETDKLSPVAWSLFGTTPRGWPRVDAIVRYVHDSIRFGYEFASPTLSAWDVYRERRGVCRDFVHLAVAFCRCMNIPARYCSGYLPSVGSEAESAPMDFTAWMEAYLDDRWVVLDPRHAAPRVGRIAVAYGRDAADVAIYTTFGPSSLERFHVFAAAI